MYVYVVNLHGVYSSSSGGILELRFSLSCSYWWTVGLHANPLAADYSLLQLASCK